MTLSDIARLRLVSQQLAQKTFTTARGLVGWMGAVQAQDAEMAKWAVGVRLPNATVSEVEAAMDSGAILRTHVLRPTWHLVAAADIRWMLALTGPRIIASLRSRHAQFGLTPAAVAKYLSIIERALSKGPPVLRDEMAAILKKAGLRTEDNRTWHVLLHAELAGIACSGPLVDGKQTYALLDARVPNSRPLSKDEALAALAMRYFTSHGPATVQDFAWWSGLTAGDARTALDLVKSGSNSRVVGSQTFWTAGSFRAPALRKDVVHLLPAYDEFTISYADRSASLPPDVNSKAISNNGIFRPIVVVNGQVVGIWKRTMKNDIVTVETDLFRRPSASARHVIELASSTYGRFLEKEIVFRNAK